tara:strand:+ start:1208 stop:1468 length:261 start_codon:yes stop_codon:yes gene_type:complete
MKRGISFWDILAWLALISILVWVTLKIFGIINTPLWLQYAPIYSACYIAGWQIHKLDSVSRDVQDLKRFKEKTIFEVNRIKEGLNK